MRRLGPTLVILSLMLLGVPIASATTGDLSFKDCVAKFVAGPCTAVPNEVLEGGRDVAVSPNGRLVFVADMNDSVVGFSRSLADGSVAYASCVDSSGGGDVGCTHLAADVLLQPRSLAFSPDGASLYVAAETSDTIVRLTVGAGGVLSLAGCVEDDDLPDWGCATEVASLDGPLRVVVSPDGGSVYAVSGDATLSHFSADLKLQSCYREVPIVGCATQAEPLQAASGLAISPNGAHLYVTSVGRDAIAWFKRGVGGVLSLVGCLVDDDDATAFSDDCAEEPGVNYDFMNHIAFNPTGAHAYVTDETGLGVVYHFTRDATTGALTRQDCLADDLNVDAPGCEELDSATGTGLSSVTDAVVSPDSANLYTVAFQDSTLSTFGLASPSGKLSFIRCLRANPFDGCAGFGPGVLDGPFGVAVSPDGHDLYVSNGSGVPALLHFEREAPGTRPGGEEEEPGGEEEPGPGPGPGSDPGPNPSPVPNGPPNAPAAVRCGGLKATKVGSDRPETLKGTPKRDVIAARGGNDNVLGLGGKDVVCGEGGRDRLGGGPADDILLGGPGRDVLRGAAGADRLVGGPGLDRLLGGPGRDKAKQ